MKIKVDNWLQKQEKLREKEMKRKQDEEVLTQIITDVNNQLKDSIKEIAIN